MKRFIIIIYGLALGMSPLVAAKKESGLENAKNSVNQALDQFADGLHQALHGAKKGGNSLLQQVDDGIHQVWHKLTDPAPAKRKHNQ
jgi:hypothetical protein